MKLIDTQTGGRFQAETYEHSPTYYSLRLKAWKPHDREAEPRIQSRILRGPGSKTRAKHEARRWVQDQLELDATILQEIEQRGLSPAESKPAPASPSPTFAATFLTKFYALLTKDSWGDIDPEWFDPSLVDNKDIAMDERVWAASLQQAVERALDQAKKIHEQ